MLSVKELAKELGVSAKTVYALVERDEIPYYRIGLGRGTLRFEVEEVKHRLKAKSLSGKTVPLKRPNTRHLL